MAASKKGIRKIIPAHAVQSLENYLHQVSAFVSYVDTVKDVVEMPEKVKTILSQQIAELRSYDQ